MSGVFRNGVEFFENAFDSSTLCSCVDKVTGCMDRDDCPLCGGTGERQPPPARGSK